MLCIGFKSFIYAGSNPILVMPPKGAAAMLTLRSILDGIHEFGLSCVGSPDSRSRQLAALRNLDAHLLNDIGLTAEEARQGFGPVAEAAKDAPHQAAGLRPYPHR